MSRKNLLPSFNYKQIISLVLLLLVINTPPSTQTPFTQQYDCPHGCECNEQDLSAKCNDIDALINAYSIKHPTKNFLPIKILDLSNNQLTKISHHLELLTNLTDLNLSHNRLTQVHKLHFDHLEKLDLSHNRITSGKLSKLPKNVIHLNLSHNEITFLPSDFMKLKKLRSLELNENPLNCTCETLMIRNWIQYQHVWTDKAIICASPLFFKGQPWVQARQNEICIESYSSTTSQPDVAAVAANKYNWDELEDENDVMMGDQPADEATDVEYDDDDGEGVSRNGENDVEGENKEYDEGKEEEEDKDIFVTPSQPPVDDEEEENKTEKEKEPEEEDKELKDDFILVSSTTEDNKIQETSIDDSTDEGSGESTIPTEIKVEEEDESSGEGSGIIPIIFESSTLGIFKDESSSEVPLVLGPQRSKVEDVETPAGVVDPQTSGDLKKAQVEDNTSTYILLAVIGILLVSLIVFVAMKNRQEKRNNRRGYDVEKEGRNGGTELQDMDKRLLGKPIEKNGNGKHENSPLINNHEPREGGFKPYQPPAITVDEPIQDLPQKDKEKSQQSLIIPNGNGRAFEPIEPVHTTNGTVPKSPDSDEEVFHPATDDPEAIKVSPVAPKRYTPIYTPVSPKSSRYSPVYSPDTGRVKIKLTETPKPKTPMVVTRSRSRAGDYVNTPNN